jgi:hypothetical protein
MRLHHCDRVWGFCVGQRGIPRARGCGVRPTLTLRWRNARVHGRAAQRNAPPSGGMRRKGTQLMGALARSLEGMGRWRAREALPARPSATGPAGAVAQGGLSGGVQRRPEGPGCAVPWGTGGPHGCLSPRRTNPGGNPPCGLPPLADSSLGGGAGKGGSQGGKTEGGVDVVRCARRASSVRMAGHQSMGLDRRRQRSGRNYEAGPLAVTGVACAARHFHSRRPSSQQASVLRRLKGTGGATPLWKPDHGWRMPRSGTSRSRRFVRVNEPALFSPWRGGDVGTAMRWRRRRKRTFRRVREPEGTPPGEGWNKRRRSERPFEAPCSKSNPPEGCPIVFLCPEPERPLYGGAICIARRSARSVWRIWPHISCRRGLERRLKRLTGGTLERSRAAEPPWARASSGGTCRAPP